MNEEESRAGYQGWRVVFGSAVALAFGPSTIAVLGLGLFMRPIEAEFGWSRTTVALATTLIASAIIVVSPLQGYLVDRFGVRQVMLPSVLAFGAAIAALSLMPPITSVYYLAWIVIPFLGIGLFPLAYLKAVSGWFSTRLGLALGLANCGVAIGSILVPLIASAAIASVGWRGAYLVLGLIVLAVTFPAVFFLVRERHAGQASAAVSAARGMSFVAASRNLSFLCLSAVFLALGAVNTIIVHQVPMLIDLGMPPTQAAIVQTVFGAFGLLGRILTGLLLDRVAAAKVMIGFILGGAIACSLYGSGVAGQMAFVCAALIGLMFGAEFDVLAYVIKQLWGMLSFGKLYGAAFAVFQFGLAAGGALLPLSRDWSGSYSVGLWVFSGLLGAAALLMMLTLRGEVAKRHPIST